MVGQATEAEELHSAGAVSMELCGVTEVWNFVGRLRRMSIVAAAEAQEPCGTGLLAWSFPEWLRLRSMAGTISVELPGAAEVEECCGAAVAQEPSGAGAVSMELPRVGAVSVEHRGAVETG